MGNRNESGDEKNHMMNFDMDELCSKHDDIFYVYFCCHSLDTRKNKNELLLIEPIENNKKNYKQFRIRFTFNMINHSQTCCICVNLFQRYLHIFSYSLTLSNVSINCETKYKINHKNISRLLIEKILLSKEIP